jgi:hypothetical protein
MFAVALPLLLGGCLEAMDLVAERVTAPAYCETPTGLALCDADRAQAQ